MEFPWKDPLCLSHILSAATITQSRESKVFGIIIPMNTLLDIFFYHERNKSINCSFNNIAIWYNTNSKLVKLVLKSEVIINISDKWIHFKQAEAAVSSYKCPNRFHKRFAIQRNRGILSMYSGNEWVAKAICNTVCLLDWSENCHFGIFRHYNYKDV